MKAMYLGQQSGTAKKSGRAYTLVFYSYTDPRVSGQAADKAFLFEDSGLRFPKPDQIKPGAALNIEFDKNGFTTACQPM